MSEEVEHVSLDPCQSSGAGTSQTGFVDDLDRVADAISGTSVGLAFSHDHNAERAAAHNLFGAKSDGEKGCSDKVRSEPPLGGGGGSPALLAARTLGGVGTAGSGARDVFFFSLAGLLNIAANLPARDFRFCGGGFDGVFPSRPSVPLLRGGVGTGGVGVGGVIGDAIDTRGDASCLSGDSSFFSSSTPSSSFGVRGDTGACSSTAIASNTSRNCIDTACAAPRDVAPASKRTCSTFSAALRVASHQASSPFGPNERRTVSVAAFEACFSRS